LKNISLPRRLSNTISLLFVIFYLVAAVLVYKIFMKYVEEQYYRRITTVIETINILNENSKQNLSIRSNEFIHHLAQEHGLNFLIVVDEEGQLESLLFSKTQIPDSNMFKIKNLTCSSLSSEVQILREDRSQHLIIYPINELNNNTNKEFLIAGFDSTPLRNFKMNASIVSLVLSLFLLLGALVFINQYSKKLFSPIKDLMEGTEQVSKGNFEYQIPVKEEDEIGQLARKFNEMILKLNYFHKQKSLLNKKLHEYNAKLEEKIKERTRQLKKIQEEVLLIFHQIPVGLLVVDLEGIILWYNNEFLRLLEITDKHSLTNLHFQHVPEIVEVGLAKIISSIYKNPERQVIQEKLWFPEKKKEKITEIVSQPLIRDDDELDGTIFILKDVTREISLEKKMIQDQRLESVGTIAGGIAHDFNNILAVILPTAQLLKLKLKDFPEYFHYLDAIERAAEQASTLSKQILAFSRGGNQENFEIINLNNVIEEFVKMFRRVLDRKINLHVALDNHIQNIKADGNQIEQILMNLSINARDAMPSGGDLFIRTSTVVVGEIGENEYDSRLKPGKYVRLEVEDNGKGIPPEIMDKIFDPFFTSKRKEEGTGLGLSVVYGIVKAHEGVISVKSQIGKGTLFTIYFPVTDEQLQKKESENMVLESGNGTLLIVDDEEMIHETLTGMLENLNYNIISAKNGKEAVEIFKEKQSELDAIIMDIQMPEMDGVEAAQKILTIDPEACIIFTSGYANDKRLSELKKLDQGFFLKKPYKIGVLADIIKRALENKKVNS